jgi:hypothetical protein
LQSEYQCAACQREFRDLWLQVFVGMMFVATGNQGPRTYRDGTLFKGATLLQKSQRELQSAGCEA